MPTVTEKAPTDALITLGDQVEAIVPVLEQTLEQGKAHERHLRGQANLQRDENVRMERALKALGHPVEQPKRKKKNGNQGPKIDETKLDLLMAYFHKHGDREITGSELLQHETFGGWGAPTLYKHLNVLRDDGKIAHVGMRTSTTPGNKNKVKAFMLSEGK